MRKAAVACGVVGLILFLGAGLLAFWITPAYVARLPADTDTTRTYTGTIASMLNPAALASGNISAAVRTGLPLTIKRRTQVLQTSGDAALVKDASTATSGSQSIGAITDRYSLDRYNLKATAPHPSGWNVVDAKGLTINWPIGANKQNYTGWEHYTYTTVPLRYVKQQQRAGISTYVYQASIAATPIKNPQVLHALPASMPVSLAQAAAAAGLIPKSLVANIGKAYPGKTTIPLGYTYQATSTYWVDPTTGVVVDLTTNEKQMVGAKLPNGSIIPVFPALVDSYKQSPSSVAAAANDAKNGGGAITALGMTVPIILAAIGFVLLVVAVVLWVIGSRRRRVAPVA